MPSPPTESRAADPLGLGDGVWLQAIEARRQRVPLRFDKLLGRSEVDTPRLGLLGQNLDDQNCLVATDLNSAQTICLFGKPGKGKSYCLGSIIEMALQPIPRINTLGDPPSPMCVVVFHYSKTPSYRPEFCASIFPNSNPKDLRLLAEVYGAAPMGLADVVLLAPRALIEERRREFPGIEPHAIAFPSGQLTACHWQILMGALGEDDDAYLQVMAKSMRDNRDGKVANSVRRLKEQIDASHLSRRDREKAYLRLDLASQYVVDTAQGIADLVKPGRLIIVDLRDEFLKKREVLSLFYVMLDLVTAATHEGRHFQKLCVFDEAHKYLQDPAMVDSLTEAIREMRHKALSVLIASQDPPSVPSTMVELANSTVMLGMTAEKWLTHTQTSIEAYRRIDIKQMARLKVGQAYVWNQLATDDRYTEIPQRLQIRPRVSLHGGDTRGALAALASLQAAKGVLNAV